MIQETHIETREGMESRGMVDGLNMIVAEVSRVHGIATYVRKSISDARIIESNASEAIYSSTIRVGSTSVTNVYKSPATQWPDGVLSVQPHPAVYAGDFNSHHGEWGYASDDVNGEMVERWNFRKANWTQYSTLLDAAIRFIPPIAQNYDRFNDLVINTAKKCISRGYRKEYVPCWEEDADRLYAEFQETEDPEIAKELLQSLDHARKQRWIETVENIDLSRSSRKGWATIRKLGGASKLSRTKSKMNADQVARRLVQSSKAPSDKRFSRIINR